MAEEEAVPVTLQASVDNPHKRKLVDLEPLPSDVAEAAEPDSKPEIDGDSKEKEKGEDENGGDEASELAKRPRLDEVSDGLASENGHKLEDDTGNDEENAETNIEQANEPPAEGVSVAQPALESEVDVKDCDKPEGKDEPHMPASEGAEQESFVEGERHSESENKNMSQRIKTSNKKFGLSYVYPAEGVSVAQPASEGEVDVKDGDSERKDIEGDKPDGKDAQVQYSDKEKSENVEKPSGDEPRMPASELAEQESFAEGELYSESGNKTMSRRIEIPNNKVGVLIGKSGETIRYLQINSGAKIQITRDADADARAPTRPVELVGNLESLNKAERLIKDVIAEADAGGSPSLVARGFTAAMTAGSAEIEMPVPSDKVGLIIGRGGETIRNLQTRSGARIQLIPQSSLGDQSKEKKVKVSGDKKQVEMAIDLIKEVMNQLLPGRPSQFSGNNFNQQGYRPRGGAPPHWGNRGPPSQPMPYDGHQRGPYPSQGHHYPPQAYGNYPPQGPPRGSFGPSWDNRPPSQGPPHSGGYDYYGQGGGHVANPSVSTPQPSHMPGHASGPSMGPPHSQANYSYGQPRGSDYSQPTPYSQTAPQAQGYGHGYSEPKYGNQGQAPQSYTGQGYATQQGYPPQQQQGYAPPQQYNRPPQPYNMPSQGAPPQGYAPPAANQQTDASYQAPVSAPQQYAQNVQQPQQQYPYASGATQQAPQTPYGSAPVASDGYAQPQPVAGYPQQGAPSNGQYGQQPVGYTQAAAPATGYAQYPATAQPGYGDQTATTAPNAATYGYSAQVDPSQAAYATGAYSTAPPVAQQGYAQPVPVPAQPGYDQSAAPQSGGYAAAPATAPAAYAKNVSPQPGYPPQYDASQAQMYATPR